MSTFSLWRSEPLQTIGNKQTRIKIWSRLELLAMEVVKELADDIVSEIQGKEDAENIKACQE